MPRRLPTHPGNPSPTDRVRDWLGEIDSLLGEVDRTVRGAARAVRSAFDDGPFEVLAYRGFGNDRSAYVYGRAQENRGVGVSNLLEAARAVMLGNAHTRLPFPGVAAFYQALRKRN